MNDIKRDCKKIDRLRLEITELFKNTIPDEKAEILLNEIYIWLGDLRGCKNAKGKKEEK